MAKPRSINTGGLEQLWWYLEQERTQQPDAKRQVDGGVDESQGKDVVQQVQVTRQEIERHQAGGEGQEARRDEKEKDVARPLDRPDGQRVGGGQPEGQHQERRQDAGDCRVDEERREVA